MATLRAFSQWVAWDYVWKENKQKYDKPPINPLTGGFASHSDPSTWCEYEYALKRAQTFGLPGVGFVLADGDDLTGIDLDRCRDPASGALEPWAAAVVSLGETYAEISPSGTGIRLFAKGKVDGAIKFDPAHVEIYGRKRYLTITGRHINNTPLTIDRAPDTIAALQARVAEVRDRVQANNEAASIATYGMGVSCNGFHKDRSPAVRGPIAQALRDPFWGKVNDRAIRDLASWVRALFGTAAIWQPGTRGYRISSVALCRDLEEDLSITPMGIKDWGVSDMGDAREGRRSPIGVVMEHGGYRSAGEAALWLCKQLRTDPITLGWISIDRGNQGQKEQAAEVHTSPTIQIIAGELPATVDQSEDALIASNRPVFVRAGELVRPVTDIVPATGGRTTTIARLRPMCTDSMLDALGQTATYERFDAKEDGMGANRSDSKDCGLAARERRFMASATNRGGDHDANPATRWIFVIATRVRSRNSALSGSRRNIRITSNCQPAVPRGGGGIA
jgi:hypothetical protein